MDNWFKRSGKSSVAKKIYPTIEKNFGPTILCSGDDLRLMFNLKKFDRNSRLKYSLSYSKFIKVHYKSRYKFSTKCDCNV